METKGGLSWLIGVLQVAMVLTVPAGGAEYWANPTALSSLNSRYHDKTPFLSFDGLTLYFSRGEGPQWHYARIFQARRTSPSEPFADAREISALNYAGGHVSSPWVSADNLRMYYYRTEIPGKRLKLSERASADEDWQPGVNLSELNQLGDLATPTLSRDELVIVFGGYCLDGGRGDWDLWMASRSQRQEPFGEVTNLAALNTEASDIHPCLAADGLTLYFSSNRNEVHRLYKATRSSRGEAFGAPEHLACLDTPGGLSAFPFLSPDGTALYFGARPMDGDMDLYVAHLGRAYYVDAHSGSDLNDGAYPETAFAGIQKGIEAAEDGDFVLVAPGVYHEAIHFLGKAITVASVGDAAVLEAPDDFAVSFYMGEGRDSILKNLVIANSYVGVLIAGGAPTITNVTVVNNEFGIEAYRDAEPRIRNSIFWNNASSDLYGCAARYSCIQRGAPGEGNITVDPMFVDPNEGDYHLLSVRGRYWPAHDVWVLDDATSPCVDAGDPAADFSRERTPNGGRLNLGAYGGTAFAGMSEPPSWLDLNEDGVVDEADLDLFVDLWEEQTREEPEPPPPPRR